MGLSVLGMIVHLLFDLINSFGVVLLWPLSYWRPELGIVFIIDFILAGLMISPLLICWPRRLRSRLGLISRISAACVIVYFLFCAGNRALALQTLGKASAGQAPSFSYVFPEPLGPHRWKGITREGNLYRIYLIHSLTGTSELKDEVTTEAGDPAVQAARFSRFGRKLEWFFKAPVWTVEARTPQGVEVSVYDLRFRSLVIRRGGPFGFRMLVRPNGSVERK